MNVTIKDLAEYCGLSMSAVSKALNGYSDISDATRSSSGMSPSMPGMWSSMQATARALAM